MIWIKDLTRTTRWSRLDMRPGPLHRCGFRTTVPSGSGLPPASASPAASSPSAHRTSVEAWSASWRTPDSGRRPPRSARAMKPRAGSPAPPPRPASRWSSAHRWPNVPNAVPHPEGDAAPSRSRAPDALPPARCAAKRDE